MLDKTQTRALRPRLRREEAARVQRGARLLLLWPGRAAAAEPAHLARAFT